MRLPYILFILPIFLLAIQYSSDSYSASDYPCTLYKCKDKLFEWDPNVCKIEVNTSLSFVLNKCPLSNYYCLVSDTRQVVSCQAKIQSNSKPGDQPSTNEECYSKKRDSEGYCVGNAGGENCTDHIDCDIGYYCDATKKVCVAVITTEGAACDDTHLCDSYLNCYNSTCRKYGHLAAGEVVYRKGTNDNCKTHYKDIIKNTCIKGPVLTTSVLQKTLDSNCNYSYADYNTSESPVCGFSQNGTAICLLKEGDTQTYWDQILAFMDTQPKCHVTHKYGLCAHAKKTNCQLYYQAVKANILSNSYLNYLVQDVPDCIKNWQFPEYWKNPCPSSAVTTMVSLGLSLLIIVWLVLM